MLSASTVAFLEQPIFASLATRNGDNQPAIHRAVDVWVQADGRSVGVLLLRHTAGRARENIADNGCVALCAAFGASVGRAIQLKGKGARIREATAAEETRARERMLALGRDVAVLFGIPSAFFENWPIEHGTVVEFEVDAEFDQSPGPGAGLAVREGT